VKRQNTVFAVGKSILKRTSKSNIGALILEYGGGGHEAAGTCQVGNDDADAILGKLVKIINQDGGIPAAGSAEFAWQRRIFSKVAGGPVLSKMIRL
jgi:hypothetical protein